MRASVRPYLGHGIDIYICTSVKPCLGHGIDHIMRVSVRPCLGHDIGIETRASVRPCLGHGIGLDMRASCRKASIGYQGTSEASITLLPEALVGASKGGKKACLAVCSLHLNSTSQYAW
ncbi:Heparan sulfate glucosamine 3-O-sulfotransferase 1 [Gossypium arboreum]|uniref:Heparan sulfate glucosamine 3-O-sulfotransferase 1 n=1 Tax=Gossypium arboreum TaxID=29729 RepID=A0A0B0P6Y8_GOSAR|nr:Heparan sulfate glucosamine 3-O-sulfotransferase 1 [Gossypium arboreum]